MSTMKRQNAPVSARILRMKVTNVFLLSLDRGYLLVDTGYEYDWDRLLENLAREGVRPGEIRFLFLTHAHDDHAGLVKRLIEANPEIRLIASERAAEILSLGRHNYGPEAGYVSRRVRALLAVKAKFDKKWTHAFPPYVIRENDILIGGDTALRDAGVPLDGRILVTPGHTDDSVSLLFDDGTWISGDAAADFLAFAGTRHCVISVNDLDAYYRNWDKILDAGCTRVFPSHGKPFPAALLRRDLRKHKKENIVPLVY
jgi:glyoxylase-like metal-dependent hydrolase (beta-lactamase superfamily II)